MLGAIIGDIVGSPYEFDFRNIKTTDFPLFSEKSEFTDDSILTLAVAQGLMDGWGDREKTREEIIRSMRALGKAYPHAGWGARFCGWLDSRDPQPYNSCGNGSAMRVSPVGWFFDDMDTVLDYAKLSAEITHNHPEGIRWAQITAAAILLGRQGKTKEEIRDWVENRFGVRLRQTCDEIRPTYRHVETCQETCPQAFAAYLEGRDFEEVLRLSVSLGGDSDTLTAIAASMAEAVYPIPPEIGDVARNMLDHRLRAILERAEAFLAEKK